MFGFGYLLKFNLRFYVPVFYAVWLFGLFVLTSQNLEKESRKPLSAQYRKAKIVRKVLPQPAFLSFSKALPKTSAFVLGLDPNVTLFSLFRWAIILKERRNFLWPSDRNASNRRSLVR